MIERFEKVYTRADLNKKKIEQLKELCKKIKIGPNASKTVMINHILNHFRNQFNLGKLYFSFSVVSEDEQKEIKENVEKVKSEIKEKKEKKAKIQKAVNKLNEKLQED